MSFRFASFVLASLFLAPALGAQLPLDPVQWNPNVPPCLEFLPANVIDWPATGFGDPAGFARTLIAELDNDLAPEAIVACSGAVGVLWCAAVLEAPRRLEIDSLPGLASVADIAVLPGEGPNGSDALLLTDDHGLRKITYTPGIPPAPPEQPYGVPAAFHGSTIATGGWTDAYPIRVEDLDGLYGLDVVGVATDHRTVMTFTRTSTGAFVAGPTFTAPANVRDVAAVNWDGVGGRELVLLTTRGLVICRLGPGDPIPPVMHLDQTGCIARFAAPSAPGGELLAWTRKKLAEPTKSELKVIGSIGTTLEAQTLTFVTPCQDDKSLVPVALAAGDYDEGSGEELLIAHETDHTAIILANLDASPWFDVNDSTRFDIAALAPTEDIPLPCSVGMPAFAQLDGQTSEDIVIPVDDQVLVFTELPHQRAIHAAQATTTFFRSSDIVMDLTEYRPGGAPTPGKLRFAFRIPQLFADRNYTHLRMTIWRQNEPGPGHWVESLAVYHSYHPLQSLTTGSEQWVPLPYGFPVGLCWNPQTHFYTQFRFVKLAGTTVESASPIFTGGLTMRLCGDESELFYEYLRTQGIPDTDFILNPDNDLDGDTTQSGSTAVAAYVPMTSQPPFQANVQLSYPSLDFGDQTALVGSPPTNP